VIFGLATVNADMSDDLDRAYRERFAERKEYREAVWDVLVRNFFQRWIPPTSRVLDLGCGWGEFINHVAAAERYGMDLNPDSATHLDPGVKLIPQSCAEQWPLEDASLDVVFSSNLFEHFLSKDLLRATLAEAARCLKPGGRLICMGPNIRYVGGEYWDFWDHHLPLTERSLSEVLCIVGFRIHRVWPCFLPYTMSRGGTPPVALLRCYLRMPWCWPLFGKQFLIVAERV